MPKEDIEKARVARIYNELGNTGIKESGGQIYEEFLTQLSGPRAVKTFTEMRYNDPVIGAMLFAIEGMIKQGEWYVEASSDSPQDMEIKDFVESCMHDMSITWDDFIAEALSFMTYGWAYFEVVHKVRGGPKNKNKLLKSKYSDKKIGWRKFALRSQDTLDKWEMDSNGGIQGMWQKYDYGKNPVLIPINKALLFRTTTEKNNPEGRSLLRPAFRPWYFKKNIEEIEGIGIERDLAGLPMLTPPDDFVLLHPDNSELLAYAKQLITGVRRDEYEGVLVPPGWKFELMASGGRRQFSTTEIINRYDKRIAMTLLAQFIMLGMERVGSYGLSKDLSSMFKMAVESLTNRIESVLNQFAVVPLLEMNPEFKYVEPPKIKITRINVPDLDDLGRFVFGLSKERLLDAEGDVELSDELRRIAKLPLSTTSKNRTVGRDPKDPTQPEAKGPPPPEEKEPFGGQKDKSEGSEENI